MDPFKWAWSSALGRDVRNESWVGVRDARAAVEGSVSGVGGITVIFVEFTDQRKRKLGKT